MARAYPASSSRSAAGGWSALHDLLVAPLHGAVALEEVDDPAVGVREHLDLEVAGPPDEPFEVDVVLAEGGGRLAPRREQGRLEPFRPLDDPHAAPPPAPARLDDPGKADRAAHDLEGGLGVRGKRLRRGDRGHAGRRRDGPRGDLVAEPAQGLGTRPDESDTGGGAGLRELRRFGQEPVAGVDGVAPRLDRDPDDVVHREIGGDRPEPLADAIGLVGLGAMEGEPVLVREHRDRGLPHLVGRAQDANRDLAAIRHQDSRKLAHWSLVPAPGRTVGDDTPSGGAVRDLTARAGAVTGAAAFRPGSARTGYGTAPVSRTRPSGSRRTPPSSAGPRPR